MATNADIAVTLRLLEVSGLAIFTGAGAVTLPSPLAVAGAARTASPAAGAVSLKVLSVIGVGVKANVGSGAAILPLLSPALAAQIGITNTITSVHPLLKRVAVAGTAIIQSINIATTLKMLTVAGTATKGISGSLSGAVTLKLVKPSAYAINKYVDLVPSVVCITGRISQDGTAMFQFRGKANLGVSWSITEGTGSIAPALPYTDQYGFAFARYDAGGYTGSLTITVSYIP